MMNDAMQLDTVIVGGGITGLYTCYQLHQQQGPEHRIALFEESDRFGGRIETVEMDGFLAEFGPMRFEKKGQPLLMNLIQALKLETCYFSYMNSSHFVSKTCEVNVSPGASAATSLKPFFAALFSYLLNVVHIRNYDK